MSGEHIKIVLAIKGKDKVLSGASRPMSTKEVKWGFSAEQILLEVAYNLIQARESHGGST